MSLRGHVSQPYVRLADADVFCLPSRSDNLPVALIEAMLAGLPVVATRVGGIPEMFDGSGAGWLVPPEDPYALADALVEAAHAGHERRRVMGAAGEAHARRRFDVCSTARQIDEVYAEALEQAAAVTPASCSR